MTQLPDLKMLQFKGEIHLITNDAELKSVSVNLQSSTAFGFDTETRPSFKKGEVHPVALLQLATDDQAYLIRLRGLTQFRVLQDLFENEQVLKTGVAIRDDLKQLQKIFKFEPRNFIELQDMAKQKGLQNFGLKGMAEEILQARLSKAAKITNWSAAELTPQQILYAATDAWVGLKLFQKLRTL